MVVNVKCLFLAGPFVGLWYLIVAFSGQTHLLLNNNAGADPGFLERGFICIKLLGSLLLILSHFF